MDLIIFRKCKNIFKKINLAIEIFKVSEYNKNIQYNPKGSDYYGVQSDKQMSYMQCEA
jgi:hypothetical protein